MTTEITPEDMIARQIKAVMRLAIQNHAVPIRHLAATQLVAEARECFRFGFPGRARMLLKAAHEMMQ